MQASIKESGDKSHALQEVALSQLLLVALSLAGVRKNIAKPIVITFLLGGMIPMFFWLVKAGKRQKAANRNGAETAEAEWLRGEAAASATDPAD